MATRSDFALELQLQQVRDQAVDDVLNSAVAAVIDFVNSGASRHRCGGRALVDALQTARDAAVDARE